MFRIELLPAAHGDAIWVEYGDPDAPHRVLIDGGPYHTYPALLERVALLPREQRVFELLVVTHIDADHIEGIVRLLRDADDLGLEFGEIWFNGRPQLDALPDEAGEPLGVAAGEYLGLLIDDLEAATGKQLWNACIDGGPLYVVDGEDPPTFTLEGGLELTLVSPDHERMLALKDDWAKVVEDEGLPVGDPDALRAKLEASRLTPLGHTLGTEDDQFSWFEPIDPDIEPTLGGSSETRGDAEPGSDTSIPNGSSLAFIASFDDHQVLLAGDAYASVLAASLERLGHDAANPLALDAFKLPHHGSIGNVTDDLMQRIKTPTYLVSTSGAQYGHPHRSAIELVIENHRRGRPLLVFNNRTETTEPWADGARSEPSTDYRSIYPAGTGLRLP